MNKIYLSGLMVFFLVVHSGFAGAAGTGGTEATGSTSMGGGGNVNRGADEGKKSQGAGAMINQMAGMGFMMVCMSACSSGQSWGCYACPMAAMALSQAGSLLGNSGDSGKTYDASLYSAGNYTPSSYDTKPGGDTTPTGTTGDGGSTTGFGKSNIGDNLAKLKALGYTVNPEKGTVTTPKGDIPQSAFSSASGMQSAGYTPAEAQAAMALAAKVSEDAEKKYNVVAMGVDGGGGGGGYEGGGGRESKDDPYDAYLKSLRGPASSGNANERRVAGKSVLIDGEPLGVKSDSIFKMIEREYDLMEQRQEVIRAAALKRK